MIENKIRKAAAVVTAAFAVVWAVSAQTTFGNLDLNSSNGVLFTAETETPATVPHKNLYYAAIGTQKGVAAAEAPQLLTCFPEQVSVLAGGKIIQVNNGHGIAEYDRSTRTLSWKDSVQDMFAVPQVKEAVSISPDGNWLCRFDKKSAARGDVVLEEVRTNKSVVLVENAEYSYSALPVLWSPDGSVLIYEKDTTLYFIKPTESFGTARNAEEFRKIGAGLISNVCWASEKMLVYIYHDLVYTIGTSELNIRSMYSDMLGIGTVQGRLITPFDGQKDHFWANAQCTALVLVQNNRTLWYMELDGTDFDYATTLFSYPFVNVPGSAITFYVFWTPDIRTGPLKTDQLPIVWVEMLHGGERESFVYKLAVDAGHNNTYFTSLPVPSFVSNPALCPDGKYLAFMDEKSVHVYDLLRWVQTADYSGESIISYKWINKTEMVIGGDETTRVWNSSNNESSVLFLSQPKQFGWNGETGDILISNGAGNWKYNKTRNSWDAVAGGINRKPSVQNAFYRVFLSESRNKTYTNAVYVRTLSGMSETRPLSQLFSQRSVEKPKVALVLDGLDNADGLTKVLGTLDRYNLKVTFFLNGEFIRRFPSGVQEIVACGHECASMFNSSSSLTSTSYITDENYIRSGLARNEDEFFAITGNELSLAWHAPLYKSTAEINRYASNAGYRSIQPTVPVLDMGTLEETARYGAEYYTSARIIEAVTARVREGGIVPVSLGVSSGTRTDYLYDSLDVLISAIQDSGFQIVKVSEL